METINDIIGEMREEVRTSQENNPDPRTRIFLSTSNMAIEDFADRLEAAYTREIGELKGERKGILKANEAFAADNTRLRGELAAKDEEILNLRKSLARVMEVTGDCRKCEECGDETCPWFGEPDGCNNREGRALFLAGKLVDPLKMKDAANEKLRALVKELADAVPYSSPCADCDVDCKYYGDCKVLNRRSLVAQAREVAK